MMHNLDLVVPADGTESSASGEQAFDHQRRASEMGLIACHHCDTVWQEAEEGAACGRCGAKLRTRKADSLNRTWALLIAACMMYLPANLLPVMITKTLFGSQNDTILSGVIYFWVSGAYGLAAIIFVASFLVPLFKLAALFILVLMAQRRSDWRRAERSRLYHVIELIGRWSMLDVFVVALLAGLVRIQGFAEITAGLGIAAFGSVVVLTMLASLSFDPKLTWDGAVVAEAVAKSVAKSVAEPVTKPVTEPLEKSELSQDAAPAETSNAHLNQAGLAEPTRKTDHD